MQSACLMAKQSTNSLSFIEYVVGSNKLASARKAHVEMPKVERFRRGKEGKESAGRPEDPPFCHEVNTCWSIFVYHVTARA